MYAVIHLQGHQYIVQEGQSILVDKMKHDQGQEFSVDTVLMLFNEEGDAVHLGEPHVKGASVHVEVVDHSKGDKIQVIKFKNKNRYKRKK